MKHFRMFAAFVWYSAGIYLTLNYVQWRFFSGWPGADGIPAWIAVSKIILELVLLVGFFILIHAAIRAAIAVSPLTPTPTTSATGESFPSEITAVVGIWLLILAAVSVVGLMFAINPICWPESLQSCLRERPDYTNALATMFGAGVGSTIVTILGFLEHASEKKDFERAYAPWYVGRPLMGMLLGLVFYFLVRGGMLAILPAKSEAQDLSPAGLAGMGALVGLFSKNAIEKLSELFDTLFSTKKDAEDAKKKDAEDAQQSVIDRLPPDLKSQVAAHLGGTAGPKGPQEQSPAETKDPNK